MDVAKTMVGLKQPTVLNKVGDGIFPNDKSSEKEINIHIDVDMKNGE